MISIDAKRRSITWTVFFCFLIADVVLARAACQEASPPNSVWLDQLDLSKVNSHAVPMGYPAKARRSVADTALTINGVVYPRGVGLHSGSRMIVELRGEAEKFVARVGMDDARLPLPPPLPGSAVPRGLQNFAGAATVEAWADGKQVLQTAALRRGAEPAAISVDLRGAMRMTLVITDDGRWPYNNPVDLVDAYIALKADAASKPKTLDVPKDPIPLVASADPIKPVLHGPRVVGASPGNPFLFRIPATGKGPLRFTASHMPAGLKLDPATGIIAGTLKENGTAIIRMEVKSPFGKDVRDLTIVSGRRRLALTPPLGWNSWNVWARAVTDEKVRQAADWMVKTGLAAHGFQYVNIDDAWMGERDANGKIRPNEKFPDMKALADYVHNLGLKLGIYSSPGPKTCQQLEGSYGHEAQDAETYATWGIDFLKYDLCSYGTMIKDRNDREEHIKPYRIMGEMLGKVPRDIVYGLCEYGRAGVWEWAPDVGGQLWRTTGDIRDSWESMSRIGFSQNGLEKWAGPGRWNDTDMMVLGKVGWGVELHQSRLTPSEQMTHLALWSLLAAPMLLGCDLSQLDKFTLDLLTNDEVLEVGQDPAGRQAARRFQDGFLEVWSKLLADGTTAVGLFNRGREEASVTARWTDLSLSGKLMARDLWQRRDIGIFEGALVMKVPAHGVALLKIGKR